MRQACFILCYPHCPALANVASHTRATILLRRATMLLPHASSHPHAWCAGLDNPLTLSNKYVVFPAFFATTAHPQQAQRPASDWVSVMGVATGGAVMAGAIWQ